MLLAIFHRADKMLDCQFSFQVNYFYHLTAMAGARGEGGGGWGLKAMVLSDLNLKL